jgi:hypothetical protein
VDKRVSFAATLKRSPPVHDMTTPKLRLHNLADKRPNPQGSLPLFVFHNPDSLSPLFSGVYTSDSDFIQGQAAHDIKLFFVESCEVAHFLLRHNLVEFPTPIDRKALAYTEALDAWCDSSYYKAEGPFYSSIREAFIKAFLIDKGVDFSSAEYRQYC